jgi:hypothetical protein
MSKGSKTLIAFCLLAVAAACAPKEPEPVFVETPVAPEPTSQKF